MAFQSTRVYDAPVGISCLLARVELISEASQTHVYVYST